MVEVNTELLVDYEQARLFAHSLWATGQGQGDIVAAFLRNRMGKEQKQISFDGDLDTVGEGVQPFVDEGWDIYITPCRFDPNRDQDNDDMEDATRRARHATISPGVWADIDLKPDSDVSIQSDAELGMVLAALPEPTISVDSGSGGRHIYWLFDEPLKDMELAKRLATSWILQLDKVASDTLGRHIKFDSVGELARVMRLPGTWRQPKAPVWTPRQVRLLQHDGPRYTASSLDAWIAQEIKDTYDRVGTAASAMGTLTVAVDSPLVSAYVKRAVELECSGLANWAASNPPGRNSMLNRAAFTLGTLGAHGLLDYEIAYEAAMDACKQNRLWDDDGPHTCTASFDSGWFAGKQEPRNLPDFSIPEYDPENPDGVWPNAAKFLPTARKIEESIDGKICWYRGEWFVYNPADGVWSAVDDKSIDNTIWNTLDGKTCEGKEKGVSEEWLPNNNKVGNVKSAMCAVMSLPYDKTVPFWTEDGFHEEDRPDAEDLILLKNGMLNWRTKTMYNLDSRLFTTTILPFNYDPQAECLEWVKFLHSLWPNDPANIDCLQEIFGYMVSGRIDLHKIPMLIGPPRCGKTTISDMMMYVVGEDNTGSSTLKKLGTNFGLENLIGKSLAFIPDARIRGETYEAAQTLLSISGGDTVNVSRKFKGDWIGRLPTRFFLVSNEEPRLDDPSGAMANRFIPLVIQESWLNREDEELPTRLLEEIPGVFNWAIQGARRLGGKFTMPAKSLEIMAELVESSSPVSSFVIDCCELRPGAEILRADMFRAWKRWCGEEHRPGSAGSFGSKLRAVYPKLGSTRHRLDGGTNPVWFYQNITLKQEVSDAINNRWAV